MREIMAVIEHPDHISLKRFLYAMGTFGVGTLAAPLIQDLIYQALQSQLACDRPINPLRSSAMAKVFWLAANTFRCTTQEVFAVLLTLALVSTMVVVVDHMYAKPSTSAPTP